MPGAQLDLHTLTNHGADSHYEASSPRPTLAGSQGTKTVRLDPRTRMLRIESRPGGGDVTLTYYSNTPFADSLPGALRRSDS